MSIEGGSAGGLVPVRVQPGAAIRIGTCAWSFDEWRGGFYPERLPAGERLAFYAKYFRTVEADSTFYASPSESTARHWMEVTPDDFRFACKMPREVTHVRRLRASEDLVREFLASIEPLRSKLACILIQLPPYFTQIQGEYALRSFVQKLPSEVPFAIEFRHPGWHLPRIAHLLEAHGVCWVWNDISALNHQFEAAFDFLPVTANFLYLRLMGDLETIYGADGKKIHQYRELLWPRPASLESWAVKIRQHAHQVRDVLVYANNHFEGFSPLTCQRIGEQLEIKVDLPQSNSVPPMEMGQDQLDLF